MNFTQGSNLPAVTLIMIIAISIIINVNIFIIVDIVVVISSIILHNGDLAVSEPKRAESLYYNTSTIAIIAVAIVPIFIIIDQVPSKTDLAMAALAFSGLLPVLIAGIVIIVFIGMFR